jgi:ribonuclease P/MRP protein subunit POP5
MRDKRRYVLVRLVPPWVAADTHQVYLAVHEAVSSLWGDAAAADIQLAVVYSDTDCYIIRCRRGNENQLGIALATVTSVAGTESALRSIAVSGTIAALKRRLQKIRRDIVQSSEICMKGKKYEAYRYGGHKVDVFEKGFKNRELLFLTEEDIEEI